jgi:hypothetical protein
MVERELEFPKEKQEAKDFQKTRTNITHVAVTIFVSWKITPAVVVLAKIKAHGLAGGG